MGYIHKSSKRIVILFAIILFFSGCSTNDWKYTLKGNGENWEAVLEIAPDQSQFNGTGVLYIGKIQKTSQATVQSLHYEAVIGTSKPGGNLKSLDLEKINNHQLFKLFTDVPNNDLITIGPGMTDDELSTLFQHVSITLTWTDETGEHSETIPLHVVHPST